MATRSPRQSLAGVQDSAALSGRMLTVPGVHSTGRFL
jgi:hypothetical protein